MSVIPKSLPPSIPLSNGFVQELELLFSGLESLYRGALTQRPDSFEIRKKSIIEELNARVDQNGRQPFWQEVTEIAHKHFADLDLFSGISEKELEGVTLKDHSPPTIHADNLAMIVWQVLPESIWPFLDEATLRLDHPEASINDVMNDLAHFFDQISDDFNPFTSPHHFKDLLVSATIRTYIGKLVVVLKKSEKQHPTLEGLGDHLSLFLRPKIRLIGRTRKNKGTNFAVGSRFTRSRYYSNIILRRGSHPLSLIKKPT